ncbi:MAG: archaeosortase A [Thermoplasmatota archaeon]
MKDQQIIKEMRQASFFILLPTIYTLLGLFIFQYPLQSTIKQALPIPLFGGLLLLFIGSFLKGNTKRSAWIRISGWIIFSFYWATQPNTLYWGEEQDIVNAFLCIAGIYVLFYLAYHEWHALTKNKKCSNLQWIAGASALAGLIYFVFEMTPLASSLIDLVAGQSAFLLSLATGENILVNGPFLSYHLAHIRIIFACTAVQSMVIFVGMILPLPNVPLNRKILGLLITVVPVYILNLIRNALITYLVGIYGDGFFGIAHNYIGKGGSLIALVLLLFILIKIVPEVFDQILSLIDLPKESGPIERWIRTNIWRKKQ